MNGFSTAIPSVDGRSTGKAKAGMVLALLLSGIVPRLSFPDRRSA